MLSHPVTDRRAWRRSTAPASWRVPLPAGCLTVFDQPLGEWRRQPRQVTDLRLTGEQRGTCVPELHAVRTELDAGSGFVVLEPPPTRYSPDEWPVLYWLLGQALGRPVEQNVQGALLYDVRDTGQDVRYGARFSVTNAESSFHTDNSFGAEPLDYVGLPCRQTARSGGLSQIVSAYSAHNELLRRHPVLLEELYRPFHVDRRGGLRVGEAPTAQFSVFAWDDGRLDCRYLRYWIEAGHEKVGEPLSAAQRSALDALDEVLGDPELRIEFPLNPGEMFWINNRWLFHNRTAFEDHAEPKRRRHYVRLWVQAEAHP